MRSRVFSSVPFQQHRLSHPHPAGNCTPIRTTADTRVTAANPHIDVTYNRTSDIRWQELEMHDSAEKKFD